METARPMGVGAPTVVLRATTDATTTLCTELDEAVAAGARSIVVDASTVDVLPPAAITAMLSTLRTCRRRGGQLLVRNPSRRAMHQLDRTGLPQVFQVELHRAERQLPTVAFEGVPGDPPTTFAS